MLVGAHVSPAGGLGKAIARGVERRCGAIQIFSQNPRAWAPRVYGPDDLRELAEAQDGSGVRAVVIHAVYLLNCATEDPDFREKTLLALTAALRNGAAMGATGVVLHPGSALKGGEVEPAVARAGALIAEALGETEGCDLLLENTAGAGGTLGRTFAELAALIDAAGGDERLGLCLDSCHLYASGYDIRDAARLGAVLDEAQREVGLERLRALHLNDSQGDLGSNRDRHANLGLGELGREGCAAFLSEPRFEGLPLVLETPGGDGGPALEEVALAYQLREEGRAARR